MEIEGFQEEIAGKMNQLGEFKLLGEQRKLHNEKL
jgi:hypothetical protein